MLTFLFSFFLVSAQAHLLDSVTGKYEGFSTTPATASSAEVPVQATVTHSGREVQLLLTGKGTQSWSVVLTEVGRRSATLESSDLKMSSIELSSDGESCLVSKEGSTHVCILGEAFSIETRGANQQLTYRLDLTPIKANQPSVSTSSDAPKEYSVSELRNRSFKLSFDSQVEFEHTFQARALAKNAWLNLLPHLSAVSIIAVSTVSQTGLSGLLGAVGDLVPFLLPNRWFQAAENHQRSEAEQDAYSVIEADAGFQSETLALSILRDQELLVHLQDSVTEASAIRDELAFRERLGQIQTGSHDDVDSLVIQLQKSLDILAEGIQEEYAALAQAAGFRDSNAVSRITPLSDAEKTQIVPINESGRLPIIFDHSYELKQIDHLVQVARLNRNERWFSWIDPAGDPTGGLGAGLGSYVQVGASQMRELEVRRTQMEAILSERLKMLVDQANLQSALYTTGIRERGVQQARVARITQNMRMGTQFVLSDLVNALQDQARNEMDLATAEYLYWASSAALDRLQMTGSYSGL